MENKISLLKLSNITLPATIPNTNDLVIKIPNVSEILDDEQHYYSIITSFTSSPFDYMVQLDDMGIDYETLTNYDLFKILFPAFIKEDLSVILGDIDISDFAFFEYQKDSTTDKEVILYSKKNNIAIDKKMYEQFSDILRKINLLEKKNYKPGNESAKKYLLEKERKKLKRNARKKYEPYLEKMVVSLVNTSEFPYDYSSCMNLSIYCFNQSLKQIQRKIIFDKTMIGVYAGTVDVSKMTNKDCLSWIQINNS